MPDLNAKLVQYAQTHRAQAVPSLKQPTTYECYDFVDRALTESGGLSAPDFVSGGAVGSDDDYTWGDPVNLLALQPGDVLQFRNYRVVVVRYTQVVRNTMGGQLPSELEQTTLSDYARPHHSAMVSKVNGQGNLEVAEQNAPVNNQGNKVWKVVFNTIDLWPAVTYLPRETSQDGLATIVTYRWDVRFVRYDNIWAYHPKPRPPKTAGAGDTFGAWGGGTATGDGTGDSEDTFGSWG
jgi:hypothetical protein